ncbi:MAG: hypothetical protein HYZ85_05620 [Candidatus Omnitrophica bacterium]|nr:hypothetical protein [Candidatus Omnitrophota bacterium]
MRLLRENTHSRRLSNRIFFPNVDLLVYRHGPNFSIEPQPIAAAIRIPEMSASGFRFTCPLEKPFIKGDCIRIIFKKPNFLKDLQLNAVIRHGALLKTQKEKKGHAYYQLGCEFLFTNHEARSLIARWSAMELAKFLERRNSIKDRLITFFFTRKIGQWDFYPVKNFQDLQRGFSLVYQEYLKRGYIAANHPKTFFNFHCLLPYAWTFIAKNKTGQIGGTISLIPDHTSHGLPADKIFSDELNSLRNQGRKIGEVGMLATNKAIFKNGRFVLGNVSKMKFLFQLFREMFLAARALGLDDLAITVNPNHVAIYRHLYFYPIGEVRQYSYVNNAPAVLMRCNIEEARQKVSRENYDLYRFYFLSKTASQDPSQKFTLGLEDLRHLLSLNEVCGHLNSFEKQNLLETYSKVEPCDSKAQAA